MSEDCWAALYGTWAEKTECIVGDNIKFGFIVKYVYDTCPEVETGEFEAFVLNPNGDEVFRDKFTVGVSADEYKRKVELPPIKATMTGRYKLTVRDLHHTGMFGAPREMYAYVTVKNPAPSEIVLSDLRGWIEDPSGLKRFRKVHIVVTVTAEGGQYPTTVAVKFYVNGKYIGLRNIVLDPNTSKEVSFEYDAGIRGDIRDCYNIKVTAAGKRISGTICESAPPLCEQPVEAPCTTDCEMGICQVSCEYTCQGACESACEEACEKTCQTTCQLQCELDCEHVCQEDCETVCQEACEAECQETCMISCQETCEHSCEEDCQKECQQQCERQVEQPVKMGLLDQLTVGLAEFLGISEEQARQLVIGAVVASAILTILVVVSR